MRVVSAEHLRAADLIKDRPVLVISRGGRRWRVTRTQDGYDVAPSLSIFAPRRYKTLKEVKKKIIG